MYLNATLDTRSLTEVIASIIQRVGAEINPDNLPQIMVSFDYLIALYLY